MVRLHHFDANVAYRQTFIDTYLKPAPVKTNDRNSTLTRLDLLKNRTLRFFEERTERPPMLCRANRNPTVDPHFQRLASSDIRLPV